MCLAQDLNAIVSGTNSKAGRSFDTDLRIWEEFLKYQEARSRRHHNNKGLKQIKEGKTYNQVKAMAKRLKLKFVV